MPRWESCKVSDLALMRSCAQAVFRDVVRTTRLQLALTQWDDPVEGIGAVVHEAAVNPTYPVWEAVGYLSAGDCLAVHPPHRHRVSSRWDLPSVETETTTDLARVTQDLVVMLLWQRRQDATWPACPEHPGRHPLRADQQPGSLTAGSSRAAAGPDTMSVWTCPTGSTTLVVGDL